MYVNKTVGPEALSHLQDDVLEAALTEIDSPVMPHGLVDYLRFPELAEFGGLVYPRGRETLKYLKGSNETVDMPTTPEGLLHLSERLVRHQDRVNDHLAHRNCGIYGAGNVQVSTFRTRDWLHGLFEGKDLMSDYDSPLSKSSFSHLLWKSMGSWRMKPGSNRVYLECRHADECLKFADAARGPVDLISRIAVRMQRFEESIKSRSGTSRKPRSGRPDGASDLLKWNSAEVSPEGGVSVKAELMRK